MKTIARLALVLALTAYVGIFVQNFADARPASEQGPQGFGCGCALGADCR